METEYPRVYAVKHSNLETRLNSRSGGVFTAVSDLVLDRGGVVYGCVLNEKFQAIHVRAQAREERNAMRGSKYIQSRIGACFSQAKQDLQEGRTVLFSGTTCQIAGLKAFLGREYENLLLMDIVCHGVPSPLAFQKYLEWTESRYKGRVVAVDFRNKRKFGWAAHVESVWIEKKGKTKRVDSRIFRSLFYGHHILRPACYQCPYRTPIHPSDITIADYWGIDRAVPGFNDNKGVSLVLIQSEKGMQWFSEADPCLIKQGARLEDSLQQPLRKNPPCPAQRETFWTEFKTRPFGDIVKNYAPYRLKERLKDRAKGCLYGRKA